ERRGEVAVDDLHAPQRVDARGEEAEVRGVAVDHRHERAVVAPLVHGGERGRAGAERGGGLVAEYGECRDPRGAEEREQAVERAGEPQQAVPLERRVHERGRRLDVARELLGAHLGHHLEVMAAEVRRARRPLALLERQRRGEEVAERPRDAQARRERGARAGGLLRGGRPARRPPRPLFVFPPARPRRAPPPPARPPPPPPALRFPFLQVSPEPAALLPLICLGCRRREGDFWDLHSLAWEGATLACARCGRRDPIVDGIPVLYADLADYVARDGWGLAERDMDLDAAALLALAGPDESPSAGRAENLSTYLDAHWGDRAEPRPDGPAESAGLGPLVGKLRALAGERVARAIELGAGVGRGTVELAA